MGDTVAKELQEKREGRRRKILENSKVRLAKISGGTIEEPDTPVKCKVIYPDPDIEREVYEDPSTFFATMNPRFEGGVGTAEQQSIFNMLNRLNTRPALDERIEANGLTSLLEMSNLIGGNANNPSKQPTLTKLAYFLQSKIHISLLVIITYALIVSDTFPTENVFMLLLVWELAEIFVLRTYEVKQTSFLTILLLLIGIPAAHSTVLLKWLELLNKVLCDVAIFVFFFVCVHIFWEHLVLGRTLNLILDVDPDYFLRTQSTHI